MSPIAQNVQQKTASNFQPMKGAPVKLNPSINGSITAIGKTTGANGIQIPGADHKFSSDKQIAAVNQYILPDEVTFGISSTIGVGSTAGGTDIFLFNNDFLNFVQDNGAGVNSITYTFQDGTTNGRILSDMICRSRNNVGDEVFGYSIRLQKNGVDFPQGFGGLKPKYLITDTYGNTHPTQVNPTANQTRGDFDKSIMVYPTLVNQSRYAQLAAHMPGSATPGDVFDMTVTVYFTPDYSI